MVIYADVLICFNIYVNYLLIETTGLFQHTRPPLFRRILAAVIGALTSLYIFAPQLATPVELLIRIFFACIIIFCLNGRCAPLVFIRQLAVFCGVSFIWAGLMFVLWFLIKPHGMAVNNGVVYFSLSPLLLVILTAAAYIILRILTRFLPKNPSRKLCRAEITLGEHTVGLNALADTGHELCDTMSNSPVVVISNEKAAVLFTDELLSRMISGDVPSPAAARFRLIPYSSVGGSGLLPAMRCDKLEIISGKNKKTVPNPIVAVNSGNLSGEYSAIIDAGLVG